MHTHSPWPQRLALALLAAVLALASLPAWAAPSAAITSNCTGGGAWSAATTWAGGVLPGAADTVTICNGDTVTIDTSATIAGLTVGQGTSGILQWNTTVIQSLTVTGDVLVSAGGIFRSGASGFVTGHTLSVGGNLTNNGTLDFSTSGNGAGAGITFTGAANATFGGTGGTTDVRGITINKGTSPASVLELNPAAFTVRGANTDNNGFLALANGTFKLSGSFALTSRIFTGSAGYSIPSTSGFWLNNPNATVSGLNGSPTVSGVLRITQGTYNVGTSSGNQLGANAGAQLIIEGGALNVASRLLTTVAVTYNQSGGTVSVNTVANSSSNAGSFDLSSTSTSFTMSGGTIVLVQANNASVAPAYPIDYRVMAAAPNITGGTLQAGTGATLTNFNFRIAGQVPALVVDNTTNAKTATVFSGPTGCVNASIYGNTTIPAGAALNLNACTLTQRGSTFTNNGTLNATAAGSGLIFAGSAAQLYTGAGAFTGNLSGVYGLQLDNPAGLMLDAALPANLVTIRANLVRGTLTNSNKLTLGTGGTSIAITQIGQVGLATAGGSYDSAPVFNYGTSGYTLNYFQEGGPRATGYEIPPSRAIDGSLVIQNSNGVVLAGGNLTVSSLSLNSGTFDIRSNTLTINGAATLSSGYLTSDAGGTVIYNQASAGQSVLPLNYGNLTFNDFAKTLSSSGTLYVAGTFTPGAAAGHTVRNSTMAFDGLVAQVVPAFTYYNLTVDNPAGASASGHAITVQNNLLVQSGAFTSGAATLQNVTIAAGATLAGDGSTLNVGGNWANDGTFTAAGSAVNFDGTTALSGAGTSSFFDVFLSIGASLDLGAHSFSVGRNWTNSGGALSPGTGTVTFAGAGTHTVSKLAQQTLLSEGFSGSTWPAGWLVENTNGDAYTWYLDNSTNPPNSPYSGYAARYTYNPTLAADDWFFSSGLALATGTTYYLRFDYGARSADFPESLAVRLGTAQSSASMPYAIFDNASIVNTTWQSSGYIPFTVASSGTYYLGFHAYSAAGMFDLAVDDIYVSTLVPAAAVFNNAVVASGATLVATSDLQFGGTLSVATGGAIDMGLHALTVSGEGYAISTSQNASTGGTTYTFLGTNGVTVDPVNSSLGLGPTTVIIRDHPGSGSCTVAQSTTLRRCYYVNPTNTTGRSATVTFYFDDSHIPSGLACADLRAYHYDGGPNWSLAGGTGGTVTCNPGGISHVTVTGVTTFSAFAIAGTSQPTAITLRDARILAPAEPVAGYALAALALAAAAAGALRVRRKA